ncbi:MAG: HNH endonuclease [Phycisphaerales bacterium]|nr:HNH endonuclease [Phycisphaerales bacterium]
MRDPRPAVEHQQRRARARAADRVPHAAALDREEARGGHLLHGPGRSRSAGTSSAPRERGHRHRQHDGKSNGGAAHGGRRRHACRSDDVGHAGIVPADDSGSGLRDDEGHFGKDQEPPTQRHDLCTGLPALAKLATTHPSPSHPPWHEGGKADAQNCQMLCKDCNRRKAKK